MKTEEMSKILNLFRAKVAVAVKYSSAEDLRYMLQVFDYLNIRWNSGALASELSDFSGNCIFVYTEDEGRDREFFLTYGDFDEADRRYCIEFGDFVEMVESEERAAFNKIAYDSILEFF